MRKKNFVSLWLGGASNVEDLDSILAVSFSDDGDFLGSSFSKIFSIGYYDDALREAEMVSKSDRISNLLAGFSYDSKLISEFKTPNECLNKEFNVVILLYDYDYAGIVKNAVIDGVDLSFIGTAIYRE